CIVQSRNGDAPAFLDTAWSVQILRGTILTLAALGVAAGLAAGQRLGLVGAGNTYADPLLPFVIGAIAFANLTTRFESPKLAAASRPLALARVTAIDLVGQVAGLATMVAWALVSPTIWALVAGVAVVGPLRVALTQLWLPGAANRWHWDA